MYFCLFWGILSHSRQILTHLETSPLPVKGSKFWPMLGTNGHWAVNTDMPHLLWHGPTFYMVISEDSWHSHLLPCVWQWSYHHLFERLRSVPTGDRTSSSRMRGERYTSTPPWWLFSMHLLLSGLQKKSSHRYKQTWISSLKTNRSLDETVVTEVPCHSRFGTMKWWAKA